MANQQVISMEALMRWPAHVLVVLGMSIVIPSSALAQGTETVVYFHTDAIGSVRMITDANGQAVERFDHAPFGEPWPAPSPTEGPRFAWSEHDSVTGLSYLSARDLQNPTGRFTSVDPSHVGGKIVDPQSWNGYAYARNNPLRFIDPDGLQCQGAPTVTTPNGEMARFCGGTSEDDLYKKMDREYLYDLADKWALERLFDPIRTAQIHGFVEGVIETIKTPFAPGPSRGACFQKNYAFAWQNTNAFFFKGVGRIARTGLGAMTGGATARSTGLTTVSMAARDLLRGQGVANLGVGGTLLSIAANSVVNGSAVAGTLELGITAGSGIDAAFQTFVAQNCR